MYDLVKYHEIVYQVSWYDVWCDTSIYVSCMHDVLNAHYDDPTF